MKKILLVILPLSLMTLTGCTDEGATNTAEDIKKLSNLKTVCESYGGSFWRNSNMFEFFTGRSHYECDMHTKDRWG